MVMFNSFRDRISPGGIIIPPPGTAGVGLGSRQKISANVSASQLKTFRMCKRLWWFQKVCGIVLNRNAHHFKIGHVLHSIAERYLLRQATTWTDLFPPGWDKGLEEHESAWMKLMAELAVTNGLWQSSDQVQVEYPLVMLVGKEHTDHRGMPRIARADTYTDEEGVRRHARPLSLDDGSPLPAGWDRLPPFVGFIDVAHLHATPAQIDDHKTAKNRKYALTPAKLAEDLQVLSYSAVPLSRRPDLDQVRLRHNVFLKDPETKTPCYSVTAYANAAMVARNWHQVISDVEEMEQLRQRVPAVIDPARPMSKGADWQKVPCAIDEGRTKDACEAYGGCPMRDVCFGRATIEQVAARAAGPDPMKAFRNRQDALSFNPNGMRAKWLGKASASGSLPIAPRISAEPPPIVTPTHHQESPMPFAHPAQPKPLAVHEVIYVLDPDNTAVQYKGTIVNEGNDTTKSLIVVLWPDVNVEPDWRSVGNAFVIPEVPWSSVSRTQLPTAKLAGYAEAAHAAGAWSVADLIWHAKPLPAKPVNVPAPVPTPAIAIAAAKVPDRKPRDNMFGGAFGALAQPAGAPIATLVPAPPVPALEVVPAATFEPRDGQIVRVLPSTNTFWGPLAGKEGMVTAVTPSEQGSMVALEIDGLPYADAAAGRFAFVREGMQTEQAATGEPGTWQAFIALQGQLVSLKQLGMAVPFNGALEKVAEHGVEMMQGSLKVSWDKIESLELFDAAKHQPGYKAPKPSKEEKAAIRAAEVKAKEDAKEQKRVDKINQKAADAAKKVVDRENARAAEKAAKKAQPAADAQPSAAAVPPAAPGAPAAAVQTGFAPVTAASLAVPPGVGGVVHVPVPAPPLFKSHEALPHLDAAIQSLQQMRAILMRI